MPQKRLNPAGEGEVRRRLARQLDTPDYTPLPSKHNLRLNRNARAVPGKAECIRRLREAMAEGQFDPAGEKFRCVLRILRRSARNKWKTFWSLRDEARDWAFFASRAERCHYLAAAWGQISPDDRRRFLRRAL